MLDALSRMPPPPRQDPMTSAQIGPRSGPLPQSAVNCTGEDEKGKEWSVKSGKAREKEGRDPGPIPTRLLI
mgnify:CR=1 FL=1